MSPLPVTPLSGSCTRRKLLAFGGVGVLAGIAGYAGWRGYGHGRIAVGNAPQGKPVASAPGAAVRDGAVVSAGGLAREDFLPHLHTEFQLQTADGPGTTCRLVAVSAANTLVSKTARFTAFSLMFSASADFVAESRIYHLIHERMGAMDLFLSPVGKSQDHVNLEAVFSQRI